MAGPATHINYLSDDGTTYRILVPQWVATFTGDATATATVGLPKGYKRRHRFLRNTNGKVIKVTVGDITKSVWTLGLGAAPGTQPAPPGEPATGWVLQGRTGESDHIRG